MIPQIHQAIATQGRKTRFPALICLLLAGFFSPSHALYLAETISAFSLPPSGPGSTIKVDGSPDTVWKAISVLPGAVSTIDFEDFQKLVILQPDAARNDDDPSKYVKDPVNGSIKMLVAYDKTALYFLFLVRTTTVFNPKSLCAPTAANLWKADAPEVYIDPSPFDADTSVYPSYFSTDSSGLVYGTSPKTIQLDKPLNAGDTRLYFRNRAMADKFQIAATPAGLLAVSKSFSASDTTTVIVEMKIPFWTTASAFTAGKSMFISWGFNMYPKSLWGNCSGTPLAYRWAKHYLNYDQALDKPPGWRAKDSTHYDPTRSWDGWGRFEFSSYRVDPQVCRNLNQANWDVTYWQQQCTGAATGIDTPAGSRRVQIRPGGIPSRHGPQGRDIRGRSTQGGSSLFIFPLDPLEGFGGPGAREAIPL
ncbi:MAG: hypothetical protein M3Y08_11535 [Fibrobacterota bacterium]|nr:hypothetical protein [Fibrobacterota bacterium]